MRSVNQLRLVMDRNAAILVVRDAAASDALSGACSASVASASAAVPSRRAPRCDWRPRPRPACGSLTSWRARRSWSGTWRQGTTRTSGDAGERAQPCERSQPSRSETTGLGLGLKISRAAVKADRGEIRRTLPGRAASSPWSCRSGSRSGSRPPRLNRSARAAARLACRFGEHDRGAGESKTVANGRKRTWRPVYQVYQAPPAYFRQLA